MAENNGGPWGGGGSGGDKGNKNGSGGGGRKPDAPQIPEIDELMRKGQEQLRVLMGGKGRGGGGSSARREWRASSGEGQTKTNVASKRSTKTCSLQRQLRVSN